MDAPAEPCQPDLSLQLPLDMYYQLIHTLRGTLSPVTDSPEDLARRDNDAITRVACLLPANADEANFAALYIAASAHAMDCLRLARDYAATDHRFSQKFGAQAAGVARQAVALRSLLQRLQMERRKRETDAAATDRAAWLEYCAIGLMADALRSVPPAPAAEAPPPEAAPVATGEPLGDGAADARLTVAGSPPRTTHIPAPADPADRPATDAPPVEPAGASLAGTGPAPRAFDAPALGAPIPAH